MSQLQERMRARVTGTPASGEHGDTTTARRYPHRVTLDLETGDYEALRRNAFEQRVPMAQLLRALVRLCRDDPEIAARAETLALNPDDPPNQ